MVQLTLLTAAAVLISSCLAMPADLAAQDVRGLCAAEPPAGFVEAAAAMAEADKSKGDPARVPVTSFALRVYMHVVAGSLSLADGYIPTSQLTAQFNVLKSVFGQYGITLIQAPISRTINAQWTVDAPGTEILMKKALRKGDYRALNIYFIKSPRADSLGYCTFPFAVTPGSDNFYRDGCTVRYDTVPGGSQFNFNKGMTAVHETGHWFGLLHTFQGGSCTGAGDSIADTPAQLSATNGCPTGRDSCPAQPGLDPIQNYMDYSIDTCYTNFSPGQKVRMYDMWSTYRASLYT